MKVGILIPARLGSARMQHKLLRDDTGRPVIVHTALAAKAFSEFYTANTGHLCEVMVATDTPRIATAVAEAGIPADVRQETAWCGTARCGNTARCHSERFSDCDVIVNWQGDEPGLRPEEVLEGVAHFHDEPSDIATLAAPLEEQLTSDPNVVKVHVHSGEAKTFSRTPVTYPNTIQLQHVGIYFFRLSAFWRCTRYEQTPAAREFSLEQLAWIERSEIIDIVPIDRVPPSINTEEDYQKFVEEYRGG
jgi:3-deoxy-manno-octulosonate cytidylyltransferase (CMP-KDO synthetase)